MHARDHLEDPDLSLVQRLNLDAFRLFIPAYLLVYGATLTTLPPGLLTPDSGARLAIGYGAVLTGLAFMWLNTMQLRGGRRWLSYGLLAGLVGFGAFIHFLTGSLFSGATAAMIGAGLCLVALADQPTRTRGGRNDYLIHLLAIGVIAQGTAFLLDIGTPSRLRSMADVDPTLFGALMIGSGALVIAFNVRSPSFQVLEWIAALVAGGSLVALAALAALRVEPLYWLLSASVYLFAAGLMLSPWWRRRMVPISWSSLRARVAAALVTTASVSILGTAAIWLSGRTTELSAPAEVLFTGIAICLIGVYALGWWWGGRVAGAQARLATAMTSLVPGEPWRAPAGRRDLELDLIAREIEELSARLVDEKAAAAHRASVSVAVERALSSSLRIETALTGLLDALVPAFCDAAVAYVREGEDIVRLAIQGPEELTAVSTYPLRQEATVGPNAVIRTGRPEFYLDAVPEHYFDSVAADQEHPADRPHVSSLMIVPIVGSDGRTDGAISAKLLGTQRRFSQFDVASLLDFASRAALAIENGRLYEAVAEASEAKDEFLGLVSHELRTPITTILGNAVLLRKDRSPEERASLAADIEAESLRLAEIVENLLAIGRLGLTATIPREPTRLHATLVLSVAEARRVAPGREFVLRSRARPIVDSNDAYAQVVLHNLLANAAKYADQDAPVEVELDANGEFAVVSILDRGPGLPAAEADRIFEAFFRGSGSGRNAGLGIGLTVCRRIVEALGGQISATARPGGGMVFQFTLPLAISHERDDRDGATDGSAVVGTASEVGGEGLEPPTFSV